jgi:3-dehydroquinate synthase
MVASPASELVVESHAGPYRVQFVDDGFGRLAAVADGAMHVLLDEKVGALYADMLTSVRERATVIEIDAGEPAKSLDRFPAYVEELIAQGFRRDHVLVAVGGGVLQDITCFLAAVLMRGVAWRFFPTTLLAQADSCIGSKSSINVGPIKNVLGTFTPPAEVIVDTGVLATLDDVDFRSGIGEILKVHAIEGPSSFDHVASNYAALRTNRGVLVETIRHSLDIKRRIIELDEFDRGPRNVMNYGHSFGHAIESATDFAVPHGIAVSIGMDMANYVAADLGVSTPAQAERMHPTLAANYAGSENAEVPFDRFLSALSSDKKNVGRRLRLVLPDREGTISVVERDDDGEFRRACERFLNEGRV